MSLDRIQQDFRTILSNPKNIFQFIETPYEIPLKHSSKLIQNTPEKQITLNSLETALMN